MIKYPLRAIEYVFLGVLFSLGFIYIKIDQLFLPEMLRPPVLLIVLVSGMVGFFRIVIPANPWNLAKFLSFWFGVLTGILIVLQHIVIRFDISCKVLIVFTFAVVCPLISGWIYQILFVKKN